MEPPTPKEVPDDPHSGGVGDAGRSCIISAVQFFGISAIKYRIDGIILVFHLLTYLFDFPIDDHPFLLIHFGKAVFIPGRGNRIRKYILYPFDLLHIVDVRNVDGHHVDITVGVEDVFLNGYVDTSRDLHESFFLWRSGVGDVNEVESFHLFYHEDVVILKIDFSGILEVAGCRRLHGGPQFIVRHVYGRVGREHFCELVPAGNHDGRE